MKNWKKLFICIIVIFSTLGILQLYKKVKILETESNRNNNVNDYANKLKGCFDLENKNQRNINESLDLIKYCMEKFKLD